MNDNDYSVASEPFVGLVPTLGLGPISWNGCLVGLVKDFWQRILILIGPMSFDCGNIWSTV